MTGDPVVRVGWRRGDADAAATLVTREWLVTNGLGGYASGTIGGVPTRRYHGLLIAALPNPLGRTVMLDQLRERLRFPDGSVLSLPGGDHLAEFRLESGLPVWLYETRGHVVERRVFMTYQQNTTHLQYRLLEGEGPLRLSLRPLVHFRPHDGPVGQPPAAPYALRIVDDRVEVAGDPLAPPLRLRIGGRNPSFVWERLPATPVSYGIEAERGYEATSALASPGQFKVDLAPDSPAALVASTETWESIGALPSDVAAKLEEDRRLRLLRDARAHPLRAKAGGDTTDTTLGELTLAADQFLIAPAARVSATTRARAQGEEMRTVIAGYHWFTDWGRDTMISLEGLALLTGRHVEARAVLRTFARSVRDGLIPNLFPEGAQEGLYHTADATLWFFHAIDRYLAYTQDRATLVELLPALEEIIAWHRRGTRFGIRADPDDGLLVQGEEGYALTWMDAKCEGWVVTPRRGKAVEVNALYYNALRALERWLAEERGSAAAREIGAEAARVHESFNRGFWYEAGGYLYDVIGVLGGAHDPAFRPNQIFAVSLPHPVLEPARWPPVVQAVEERLLTPVGLRSLARGHRDYKPTYHGDLRTRDAAYHQGTVWSWLIGPFVDAWLKVHPTAPAEAHRFLAGLRDHIGEACVGQVSEVFDAEPPFTPRGCIAQAWGIAELARAWRATAPPDPS